MVEETKRRLEQRMEGNNFMAILLLLAMSVGMFLVMINAVPSTLGIGFGDAGGVIGTFFIILLRVFIAPIVIGLCLWVIFKIIKG